MTRTIHFPFKAALRCAFAFGAAILVADAQQPTLINLGTQGRNIDFSNAQSTRPVQTGTALPGTCAVGNLFFNTTAAAGQNLFGCAAANTWVLQGAAAAGLKDPGANGIVVRTAVNTTTAIAAPAGTVVGTTDTQTLTNKSINASEINSGTLLGALMPAFSGDISTSAGSTATTLATVNSSPGTFGDASHAVQLTVDGKGRVTSVSAVAASGGGGISALTGDVTASGSGSVAATLAASGVTAGTYGDATHVPQVTFDAKGRATGVSSIAISAGGGGITQLTGDGTTPSGGGSQPLTLATVNNGSGVCGDATHVCQVTTNAKGLVTAQTAVAVSGGGSGITQLTGDVTTPSGSGSQPATLATVNSTPGSYGSSTTVPVITVNGKGLITGISTVTITGGGGGGAIPAGPLASIGSTCTAGSLYFATDQPAGQQIFTCSSANTWTQIVNLGGSGALAYTSGSLDIVTSVVPRLAAANSFSGMNTFSQAPVVPQSTPASSSASCTAGQLWADANYVYSCTATNTIKRAALSSF